MTTQGEPTDAVAEPVNPLSAAKPAIAWIERQRATITDVQRYTRFVGIMKRALPMAAAALLAAVVAYSIQPRLRDNKKLTLAFQSINMVNNDLMKTKPRLTGVNANGNPYVVTAEAAIEDPHNSKRASLRKVEADLTLKNGTWVNVAATRGFIDAGVQKLWLSGVIDVFSDNGYEAHTPQANVNLQTGVVIGDRYVTGQGPFGTFRADKFRVEGESPADKKREKHGDKSDKTRIFLYGNVHMTLLKHGMRH